MLHIGFANANPNWRVRYAEAPEAEVAPRLEDRNDRDEDKPMRAQELIAAMAEQGLCRPRRWPWPWRS